MKKLTGLIVLVASMNAFALVGAGFHWGFDFSTSMTDVEQDDVFSSSDLDFGSMPGLPGGLDLNLIPDTSFMFISRTGFERTPINFGGKVFIDVLPITFEASVNMGIWQYDGVINYMDLENTDISDPLNPVIPYAEQALTIADLGGVSYFGVDKTPYGKFHLDLTARKDFGSRFVQPSIGIGFSAHFSTPVLSSELITNALELGTDLSSVNPEDLTSPAAMTAILDQILEGAKDPQTGMHFVVGLKVKPPLIPLAVFVDGKYMMTFNPVAEDEGFETRGFLVNIGVLFNI